MTPEFIWRATTRGPTSTCTRCDATYTGDDETIAAHETAHDPDVCAHRANTNHTRPQRTTL